MSITIKKQPGRIRNTGMGGFLNPPNHPEYSYSVEFDLRQRPENRGSMSLTCASTCEWLDEKTKHEAKELLDNWKKNKPEISSQDVQDWIYQVLGYFRGCYKGDYPHEWNVSNLRTNQKADPMLNIDLHAGVHFIRQYYPEFVPNAQHFDNAYWGKKPEKK